MSGDLPKVSNESVAPWTFAYSSKFHLPHCSEFPGGFNL